MSEDFDTTGFLRLGPHAVPAIWRHMLPEDLTYFRYPSECRSTCSACPKVKEENFHPDYRCCTYHPNVPNFLLGMGLEDPTTTAMFGKVISDGFATPEGTPATSPQMIHSLELAVSADFGKLTSVACRFLDPVKRECRAYKYRNSVCSTFFCKHDDEENGKVFWERLQSLAGQVEAALSQWTMGQMGIDPGEHFERVNSMISDFDQFFDTQTESWSDKALRLLWGKWFGREDEFFRGCAKLVRENRDSLYEIAEKVKLLMPREYDKHFRSSLPRPLQRQLDADYGPAGEPVSLGDLWYQLQLAHRNLWLNKA